MKLGRKINAIQIPRDSSGLGLRECKGAVDDCAAAHPETPGYGAAGYEDSTLAAWLMIGAAVLHSVLA